MRYMMNTILEKTDNPIVKRVRHHESRPVEIQPKQDCIWFSRIGTWDGMKMYNLNYTLLLTLDGQSPLDADFQAINNVNDEISGLRFDDKYNKFNRSRGTHYTTIWVSKIDYIEYLQS